jgi:hypothetical protein
MNVGGDIQAAVLDRAAMLRLTRAFCCLLR